MEPIYHSSSAPSSELFELLCKLQSSRLDDQRCSLPGNGIISNSFQTTKSSPSKIVLQETLKHPPPYPSVVLTPSGGYWIETPDPNARDEIFNIDVDDTARLYRAHFLGFEHFNFYGTDDQQGPVLVSLKVYNDENDNERCARVILRLTSGTSHQLVHENQVKEIFSPLSVVRFIMPELVVDHLYPIVCPQTSDLVAEYDEHSLVTTFKFGLIYQKFGQISEESLFHNKTHSPAMEEFMHLLGKVVKLSDHQGYRGGLDTKYGQTGEQALYEVFRGCEVIFHVSTLLPFSDHDSQQLQRKCHIGNDILAIVFQDTNTPFCPDMIASHFLHAYIVVQAIDPCTANTRYKVSVTSRDDVPFFGPNLPSPAIFTKGNKLKEFLLSKLINGERACYKATKFYSLQQRTHATLLENVTLELKMKTEDYISAGCGQKLQQPSSKLISKLTKRALGGRSKSQCGPMQIQSQYSNTTGASTLTSCSTTSTGSSSKALRNNQTRSDNILGKKSDKQSFGSFGTMTGISEGRGCNKTSIMISGHSATDSGHGDSDHSLASSPQLDERDSETDDNSDSVGSIMGGSLGRSHHRHHRKSKKLGQPSRSRKVTREKSVVQLSSNYVIAPECRSIISGSVTTVHVEANNSASTQLAKLQDEISRLRVDKLELLRQILSVQHDVRRLQDREAQLQSDLKLAGREIRRLKTVKAPTLS